MRVGIKILDEAKFREILDDGFDRLGYQLANSDVDEELYLTHYSHLTPHGRGAAYLLKFTKAPGKNWDVATLLDAATNGALAICRFEAAVKDSSASPHRRWAERILEMCAEVISSGDIQPR